MFLKKLSLTLVACLLQLSALASPDKACDALSTFTLKHAEVLSATSDETVCKVVTRVWPPDLSQSPNSFIDVSTWLPSAQKWNGRFIGLGNGGYSPRIPIEQMQARVTEGFVVGATDTGHKTESLDFVLQANERIDYWGRTSVHTLSKYSKQILKSYYQKTEKFSYFAGCSTGGHQALSAVQYYPNDYDGVLAGAPGNNRVALNAAFLWLFQQTHEKGSGKLLFTRDDLLTLERFHLKSCDELDGSQDNFIAEPMRCKPDYQNLVCHAQDTENCLPVNKVNRIKKILAGPHDPLTGENIYPGFLPGSELVDGYGWMAYWADRQTPTIPARADFWQYWVFNDPNWDNWQFDWHKDYLLAKTKLAKRIDATQTNISPFLTNSGKLLMYHGLADSIVSATDSLQYFKQTMAHTSNQDFNLQQQMQLYLIPGMSHCGGGARVNRVDFLPALIDWVEKDLKPDNLSGSRVIDGNIEYQQGLYPYSININLE